MTNLALDLLWSRRLILAGDHVAGKRFAFLALRRNERGLREKYDAAAALLDKAGALAIVECVVVNGEYPRSARGLSDVARGLDILNQHFRATDQLVHRALPDCRVRAEARAHRSCSDPELVDRQLVKAATR